MSILTLPTDYLIEVLSSWIQVQDLTKLDSSVVNSSIRTLFLQTISLPYFVLSSGYVNCDRHVLQYGCYKWMVLRQVRSDCIVIELKSSDAFLVDFFRLQESSIKILELLKLQEGQYDSTLCANCVNLTSLALHTTLWDVASSLPCPEKLKSLFVDGEFTPKQLYAFTSVCKNIERLQFDGFVREDINDATPIDLNNLLDLRGRGNSQNFGWLTQFTKKLKSIQYNDGQINELDFNLVIEHCSHLESVTMLDENKLSIQYVESLVSNNKNLKSLSVSTYGNADNVLRKLINNCSNVHTLNLRDAYASETMWIKFVTAFPSLIEVNLAKSTVTTAFIREFTSSCHNIEYLNMNDLMLSDEDVIMITQANRNLAFLLMFSSSSLTDVAIEAMVMNCSHMTALVINCENISFQSIEQLVQSCTQLDYILLDQSHKIKSQLELLHRPGLKIIAS